MKVNVTESLGHSRCRKMLRNNYTSSSFSPCFSVHDTIFSDLLPITAGLPWVSPCKIVLLDGAQKKRSLYNKNNVRE